ncbi:MAG: TadG family pilus assembly protein, partial [Acidobacteriota bacterium]
WAISLNKANNVTPNYLVQTGYWNLTGTPAVLQQPDVNFKPGPNDVPAVMVTESVSCNLFFMPVLGINSKPVSAHAVAAGVIPSSAGPRTLLPFALAQPLYDQYWDFNGNKPKIDPKTGSAYVFDIGPTYHNPAEAAGQWTSGDTGGLTGNPSTVNIGDEIYIQPDTPAMASLYQAAGGFKGRTVFVPVIALVEPGTFEPVVAFGALHIIDVGTDPGKQYIEGYFVYNVKIPIGGPGGLYNYGVYTSPVLVK